MAQTGLTDFQQGILMLLAFVLPSFTAWLGTGAPTDHTALAMLAAAVLAGVLAFVKEQLGAQTPPPVQSGVPAP